LTYRTRQLPNHSMRIESYGEVVSCRSRSRGVREPSPGAGNATTPSRSEVPNRSALAASIGVPIVRTLALLTRSWGVKLGANDHRHWSTPGHVQALSLRLNGASGHAGHIRRRYGNASSAVVRFALPIARQAEVGCGMIRTVRGIPLSGVPSTKVPHHAWSKVGRWGVGGT